MFNPEEIEPLVSLEIAAAACGINPRSLRDRRYEGRDGPPYYKLNTNVIRYKLSEVIAWRDGKRDAGGAA